MLQKYRKVSVPIFFRTTQLEVFCRKRIMRKHASVMMSILFRSPNSLKRILRLVFSKKKTFTEQLWATTSANWMRSAQFHDHSPLPTAKENIILVLICYKISLVMISRWNNKILVKKFWGPLQTKQQTFRKEWSSLQFGITEDWRLRCM